MPLLTCPNCNVGMTQANRSGVEIDVCPQCRGVWLDRGELEKMLEPLRNAGDGRQDAPPPQRGGYYREDDDHRGHHDDRHGQPGRRRNSILDIFD